MQDMRVCVIGGGSVYTPELVEGFISRPGLPVREIVLMDVDEGRLRVVGGLAQRMVQAAGAGIKISLTTELGEALEGAKYVIAQLRVGGTPARIQDERIPLRFGIVGQETTGPGGFSCALRTIPVMLKIAEEIEKLAPDALLVNFTNPAGLVTEALLRHTRARAVGLCNVPLGMRHMIAGWLEESPQDLELFYSGLNHLSWVFGVRARGKDLTEKALSCAVERARKGDFPFSPELVEVLGAIPSYYLRYYYHHDEVLEKQLRAGRTRGEEVLELEAELLRLYAESSLAQKPELLGRRGGARYSQAAVGLISALHHGNGEVHILNVRNDGAIPDLPDDCVVEVPARVGREGIEPLPQGPLPPGVRGLVQAVKAYEELTVKAAVEGDARAALQALLAHPLVPSFSVAKGLWAAIKKANRAYLPQFGGRS